MTSGAILPTIGPPSPAIRRPAVSANLQPNPPGAAEPSVSGNTGPLSASGDRAGQNGAGGGGFGGQQVGLGAGERGTSGSAPTSGPNNVAVAVQVRESAAALSAPENQNASTSDAASFGKLTPEEEAIVKELKAIDREVRAHEQAHAAAGGAYAGAPQYEFVRGPDGVQYAVAGKVQIDTSPVAGDPAATLAKMEVVKAAAQAPARPSGQDRAVAAAAEQAIRQAEADLRQQEREEAEEAREAQEAQEADTQTEEAPNLLPPADDNNNGTSQEEAARDDDGFAGTAADSGPASADNSVGLTGGDTNPGPQGDRNGVSLGQPGGVAGGLAGSNSGIDTPRPTPRAPVEISIDLIA